MPPGSSLDWKRFYAAEREALLSPILDFWLDLDPAPLPEQGFLVFPHTRLLQSVEQIVPAVLAVLHSRADEVLALGPLHGGRVIDKPTVSAARAGDPAALLDLRAVHSGSSELAEEEFSLDTFEYLLTQFAQRLGRNPPRVHRRHPFLTGPDPTTLPGFSRLLALARSGIPVVATADLIHHGAGYRTPPEAQRPISPHTLAWAENQILQSFELTGAEFQHHAIQIGNDFRDTAPVLRFAFNAPWRTTLHSLTLVPYHDVLQSPALTWVAAALVSINV